MSVIAMPQYWMAENISTTPTVTGSGNFSINGIDHWVAIVFSMPKTATITDYYFFINTLTTGCQLEVRLETVDKATGIPTGNLIDANAVASINVTTAGIKTGNFPAGITISAGTLVSYMMRPVSGTPVSMNFGVFNDAVSSTGLPHLLHFNGTTEQLRFSLGGILGLGTGASALPIRHAWPAYQTVSVGYSVSGTNTYGNRMRIDIACRIAGARVWFDSDGPSVLKLYDTDGATVLASATMDQGMPPNNGAFVNDVYFTEPVTLTTGEYFLVVEATTSTQISMYRFLFNPIKFISASPFGGDSLVEASTSKLASLPAGLGNWNINLTTQFAIIPIIDGIDVATGGGGGETSHVFST